MDAQNAIQPEEQAKAKSIEEIATLIQTSVDPNDPAVIAAREKLRDPAAISFGLALINAKFGERTLQAYCGDDLAKQLDAISYAITRSLLSFAKDLSMVSPGFLADYFVLSARQSGLKFFGRMIDNLRPNPETILPELAAVRMRIRWSEILIPTDPHLKRGKDLWLDFFSEIMGAAFARVTNSTHSQGSPETWVGSPRTG